MIVRKPTFRQGAHCVVVAESMSPLSKEIEVIPCISREAAWKTYRRIKKEQGKML
jgi:hypothetical protein